MRIAIDIDEVLADLFRDFLSYYNDLEGTSFRWEDFGEYDWWISFGISKDDLFSLFDDYMLSHPSIATVDGAKAGIKYLKDKNHELVVVTSRPKHLEKPTLDWLNVHFGDSFDKVVFGGSYSSKSFSKGDVCVEEGCEFLIEDQIRYAEDSAKKGVNVVLFNKPWNQRKVSGITRVNDWAEICNIF